MEPVTAAGLGIAVTSLVLQVFAKCVKGYQLFIDAKDFPASYQHLRLRLRLEQLRLLLWGKEVGLLEEVVAEPSQELLLNRSIIIDILLEIHVLFKESLNVQDGYDNLVLERDVSSQIFIEPGLDRSFSTDVGRLFDRTMRVLGKTVEIPKRLKWAAIRQGKFVGLVEKLAGFNKAIESLLDRKAIKNLCSLQLQTHMVMLQVNTKVDDLQQMCSALQVQSDSQASQMHKQLPSSPSLLVDSAYEMTNVLRLARFKARGLALDDSPDAILKPLNGKDVLIKSASGTRSEARFGGEDVWVEWKRYRRELDQQSDWNYIIETRVKKLAMLLGSSDKPEQFRAPDCIGYFDDQANDRHRYGFVYDKPQNTLPTAKPISLLDLLSMGKGPSLNIRVALAQTLATCLMYLHAVNWLHKSFRSDSVVFFTPAGVVPDYTSPILAGFDYARPDLNEEQTDPPPEHFEYDVYRHPDTLGGAPPRSKKSYDIYSLGIVLVEIAFWKRIDEIIDIEKDEKAAKRTVRNIRNILLCTDHQDAIREKVGLLYAEVIKTCLSIDDDKDLTEDGKETDGESGARLQQMFSTKIVDRLGAITL